MLAPQTPLPTFVSHDDEGNLITNETLRGTWCVLYFYPRDNTPGCTQQACSFRDAYAELRQHNVKVYGISTDNAASHAQFKKDFSLPFPLLVDTDHTIAELLDVWVEKSMYGKKYLGIERSTYIINPQGVIVGSYQKVKPADHAPFILKEIKRLQENNLAFS
jgi:peroxiredoxin Q/BCP